MLLTKTLLSWQHTTVSTYEHVWDMQVYGTKYTSLQYTVYIVYSKLFTVSLLQIVYSKFTANCCYLQVTDQSVSY